MHIETGAPFKGRKLEQLKAFLGRAGLEYEEGVHFSVCLYEHGEILATGSLDGNVFKCIAVREDRQGEDLTAKILTELRKEAIRREQVHLFLFTKPGNIRMFADFGFYPIASTPEALLMENRKNGARDYARSLAEDCDGVIGAAVVNCNPFTLGHRYLIETASARCDLLHLFVLTEDRSRFPSADRLQLVQAGTSDIPNVRVHETGPYMISSVTFPTYFIKDKTHAQDIACRLDLEIFARIFAREMGITVRFVGTEPNCQVTSAYNRQMLAYLPPLGIRVEEIQRKEIGGVPISASRVRALIDQGEIEKTAEWVPPTTYQYIRTHFAKEKKE
ncbi:MAG TPA: [citrate (pro-3S)-lyase] ligase [Clostridiales bacterium]|nr:[citrate (pro-3S)-lyase] ligase [Clostridiales bacterium]